MSIDSRVSSAQIKKAVKSLVAYADKTKAATQEEGKTLFADEDENVWLVITTKTMSPQLTLKPQRVPLVHPIVDPRSNPICLITKDPQRAYKDLLQKNNINFISRVVGISKLKGKWAPFEARRQLAGDYGLFLADERVIPLLPKLLGKIFFKKKKQPIPVNLLKKDLKSELEAAISSTYLHQNAGTCTSIKVAHTGMSIPKILANVEKSIPGAVSKLHLIQKKRRRTQEKEGPKKGQASEEEKIKEREEAWENIQSLGLKTHSSVCLPIWSCSLADRWNIPTVASTSNGITGTKDASKSSSSMAKSGLSGDEAEDTMSEGDEEERKLAERMEKSSLSAPKSKSEKSNSAKVKVGDGEKGVEVKKKKRKAEEVVDESVPVKKSKLSDSSTLEKMKSSEKAKFEKSKPAEKASKKDKGSISSSSKTKITDGTKPKTSDAVSSTLKTISPDIKATEGNKKLERAKAADFMDVDDSRDSQVGKKEKEKKKKDKASSEIRDALSTKAVTSTTSPSASNTVHPSTSTSITTSPSSSSPDKTLKSALKKADSNLTTSELKEKKVKRASFSVVEKKKEKLTKGVISSGGKGGAGKSGVSGKSKKTLVGRGPRM